MVDMTCGIAVAEALADVCRRNDRAKRSARHLEARTSVADRREALADERERLADDRERVADERDCR